MEPNENTYNGWTNYETWVTALWLDNDQASYAYWRAVACECRREAGRTNQAVSGLWTEEQAARYLLADQLKAEVTEGTPVTGEASLYADLLGAALSAVNWYEIANHYLADLDD